MQWCPCCCWPPARPCPLKDPFCCCWLPFAAAAAFTVAKRACGLVLINADQDSFISPVVMKPSFALHLLLFSKMKSQKAVSMVALFSKLPVSAWQKSVCSKKLLMASIDLFHGCTKLMATCRARRASLNSPSSSMRADTSSLSWPPLVERTLAEQLDMLKYFNFSWLFPGFAMIDQPLLVTQPRSPTLPMT